MKFWTSIHMGSLPAVFGTGLDDRFSAGFQVYNDAEFLSEDFMQAKEEATRTQAAIDAGEDIEEVEIHKALDEFAEHWAFLTFDIPDDEINEWLVECVEITWAEHSNVESEIESAAENGYSDEDTEKLHRDLHALETMESGTQSLAYFNFACLGRVIEPYMINLIDPTTMMEAIYTGERVDVTTALWQGEATSLTSLSPAFWTWLMMLLGQILSGGGAGTQSSEELDTAAASRKAAARRARRRRSGRGKKKKKRSGARKGVVTA